MLRKKASSKTRWPVAYKLLTNRIDLDRLNRQFRRTLTTLSAAARRATILAGTEAVTDYSPHSNGSDPRTDRTPGSHV